VRPPTPNFREISLPLTNLHTVTCGSGPPLIIVPATVSLITQWMPLAQFVGQRFTATFAVPKTVEALVDELGYDTFNLMGFSFGGLLALRTLDYLKDRIENVILLSPVVSCRAVKYSQPKQLLLKAMAGALQRRRVREIVYRVLHSERLERPMISGVSAFSNIDRRILEEKGLKLPITTLDVLGHTLGEILGSEFNSSSSPFKMPCFFAMSIYDDLLDYELTESIVRDHFTNLTMRKFYLPYHQPPQAPTFDWLMEEFGSFLEIMT